MAFLESKTFMNQKNLKASIDLGTNTCLLLIVEWDVLKNTWIQILEDQSRVVKLGEKVDATRTLQPEAMKRTLICLQDFRQRLDHYHIQPQQVMAVTTATARDALNSTDFFKEVENTTGIRFKTLSGHQEAQAAFEGGLPTQLHLHPEQAVIVDIGGGSTELTTYQSSKLLAQSLQMGSVRFTDRYFSTEVTDETFWKCRSAIDTLLIAQRDQFIKEGVVFDQKQLIAVAGTATTLARVHGGMAQYDREQLDQTILTRGDLHRLVEELKWRNLDERRLFLGVDANRAEVILAGAMILWRVLEIYGFKQTLVSTRGLRFGVLKNAELITTI